MLEYLCGKARVQCQNAIVVVTMCLPGKDASREEVLSTVLQLIHVEGNERDIIEYVIRRFISACPCCHGVDRRKRYWDTLIWFFGELVTLDLYLNGFPRRLTLAQYAALEEYLVKKRKYPRSTVESNLERFTIRNNHGLGTKRTRPPYFCP